MFVLSGNSEQVTKMFRSFGLNEYEARVYFTLQVCGKTRAGKLWKNAGVPQSKVYYVLDSLTLKGLVENTAKFPREVKAKQFLRFALEFMNEKKILLKEIADMIEEHKEAIRKGAGYVQVLG